MKKVGKVLLVDDDEVTCFLNKNLLERMEVAEQVEAVHNGMQALQYIKGDFIGSDVSNKFDLLFLDLNMPVMNGFEFLEELQKLNDFEKRKLAIAILSSSDSKKDAKEAALYNDLVCCYLTKPLQKDDVMKVIESLKQIKA